MDKAAARRSRLRNEAACRVCLHQQKQQVTIIRKRSRAARLCALLLLPPCTSHPTHNKRSGASYLRSGQHLGGEALDTLSFLRQRRRSIEGEPWWERSAVARRMSIDANCCRVCQAPTTTQCSVCKSVKYW
jgi:hypothetical protein